MAIKPLPETNPPESDDSAIGEDRSDLAGAAERPIELSDFSQRLASFGLGETPDPLLTEARPPAKRRSRT
jgi:hypothetical protein